MKKEIEGQKVHSETVRYVNEPDEKWLKELRDNEHEYFTFSTLYTVDKLKNLRKRLITAKFIGRDITEAQFAAIFRGQMLNRIKPIQWIDSKESLRFFLETLIPGIIHHSQVAACFVDPDGKPFQINKPNRKKENIVRKKGVIVNDVTIKGKKLRLYNIIFRL